MNAARATALVFTLTLLPAFAELEIKGTQPEISSFAESVDGRVTITTVVSEKLSSKSADVALSIVSSATKLASAIKKNAAVGKGLEEMLATTGIPASAISSQALASTPEYGWFSDKPKSYTVTSRFHVRIDKEAQFLAIAEFVDTEDDIRYAGIKPHLQIVGTFTHELEAAALDALSAKREAYEAAHGVKLLVHSFTECKVTRNPSDYHVAASKGSYGLSSGRSEPAPRGISMGEANFTGELSAIYTIAPR